MTCIVCNDTREVTRFVSQGYDHPPTPVKAICPVCVQPPPPRDYGPQRPFFIVPPKEKQ